MTTFIIAVLAVLAVIAWAGAMRTMTWLGDAEDIIDALRPYVDEYTTPTSRALVNYSRRTPRRSR